MALFLYNTLSRKKEEFKPVRKGEVRMYVCGPTVNDVPHLGHARSQITFDTLRRYLKFSGYNVKFASNITDIEDKIINKAHELGIPIDKLTKMNEAAHVSDYSRLNVLAPDERPHATEYIDEMIELIQALDKKGYAYVIADDGVYYDISKFKDYGKLSHQKTENLKKGARVKVKSAKKNEEDFVLWKFSKPNEPAWESPWGSGRPGWHIECSAMSHAILGLPFDIHGGGQDLIFPHHEDEIAQTEAGYGSEFARYWVHNGMVNVDKVKMSKSLGNFRTIRDLLATYEPAVLRYFVLSGHYRQPVDFSASSLNAAKSSYERLKRAVLEIEDDGKRNEEVLEKFKRAMDEDLNTPKALAVLWGLVRDNKAVGKVSTIKEIEKVFALSLFDGDKIELPAEAEKLVKKRDEARAAKDWTESDRLRNELMTLGYIVEDSKEGTRIRKA